MRGRNQGPARLTLFIAAFASLAYMGGGIALIASSQSFGRVFPEPGLLRYSMGILLFLYGAYRAYRAYQRFQEDE